MKIYLVLLVLLLPCCHKTVAQKTDLNEVQQINAVHTQSIEQDSSNKDQTVTNKITAPTVTTTQKLEEDYGWVPPPPNSPVDAKPQWKPIHKMVENTTVKQGQVVEKVTANIDSAAQLKQVVADNTKINTVVKEKDSIKTKLDVGLTALEKFCLALGLIIVLIIFVAIFQPGLLKTMLAIINDFFTKLRNKLK